MASEALENREGRCHDGCPGCWEGGDHDGVAMEGPVPIKDMVNHLRRSLAWGMTSQA